jgi:hypothetical protein
MFRRAPSAAEAARASRPLSQITEVWRPDEDPEEEVLELDPVQSMTVGVRAVPVCGETSLSRLGLGRQERAKWGGS